MRYYIVLSLFLLPCLVFSQMCHLTGQISDAREPLIGASVKLLQNSQLVRGGVTDVNGHFQIQIPCGTYDLETSYTGYFTKRITNLSVLPSRINTVDIQLEDQPLKGGICVYVCHFSPRLISPDNFQTGRVFSADQIRRMY